MMASSTTVLVLCLFAFSAGSGSLAAVVANSTTINPTNVTINSTTPMSSVPTSSTIAAGNTTTVTPTTVTATTRVTTVTPTTATATTKVTTVAPNTTTAASNVTTVAPTTVTATTKVTTAVPTTATQVTTVAPNTTTAASNSTTFAPNTTTPSSNATTAGPNTTEVTTAVTGNSTANTTGAASTTIPATVTPKPYVPSFRVNNSDGEVCMLLDFNATMVLKYKTKKAGVQTSVIHITNTTDYEGFCDSDTLRNFTLYYPDKNMTCAELVVYFNVTSNTTYYNRQGIYVRYIEPCFRPDALRYNEIGGGLYPISYKGTIGKSFKCKSKTCHSKSGLLTVLMDNILFQPFAQESSDKGSFGDVETCPDATPTPAFTTVAPPPTKPSPSNGGKIAGIVIGVLLAVIFVIAVAVYIVRKRKYKAVSYGNLGEN